MSAVGEDVRAVEAVLFASETPLARDEIAEQVGPAVDVAEVLSILEDHYRGRGIELVERGKRWHFQTAPDLAHLLRREREDARKLSRAAAAGISRRRPILPISCVASARRAAD